MVFDEEKKRLSSRSCTVVCRQLKQARESLDARTDLLLLLLINFFVLAGPTGPRYAIFRLLWTAIPIILLCTCGMWRRSLLYLLLYVPAFLWENTFVTVDITWLQVLATIYASLIGRLLPAFMMANYLLRTQKTGTFIASLQAMHLPNVLLIPLTVVFRMVPGIREESAAISASLKVRGQKKFYNPMHWLEFRLVPLVICVSRIGNDLATAAVCRGLSRDARRSSVYNPRLSLKDYIVFGFAFLLALCQVLSIVGVSI